ncbi:MAG: hypothetical protein ACT4TC_16915 [Myxococcaceae bacterium]
MAYVRFQMPSLLLHLTAVERLAANPDMLPREMTQALLEDLPYAHLGAALPDLPLFDGLRGGFELVAPRKSLPYFAKVFHGRAPVALGIKMAELVANGALVGTHAGLALVCGYFTHLCLDRVLHPIVDRLVAERRTVGQSELHVHRQIEWAQALRYVREFHGREMVGDPAIRSKFQVLKSTGLPTRGVGKGMYEVIRLACNDTFNEAPPKVELDGWIRGLYLAGLLLSSPLGRSRWLNQPSGEEDLTLYRGEDFDVHASVEESLALSRDVLNQLWSLILRQSFTPRSREKIFAFLPEGSITSSAA